MKNNIIIATIIVIVALSFYWFEVRPSNARKECASRIGTIEGFGEIAEHDTQIINTLLKTCLYGQGVRE